jgi:hypothetical protein
MEKYELEYRNHYLIADSKGCTVVNKYDPFNTKRVESVGAARILINKISRVKGKKITWK